MERLTLEDFRCFAGKAEVPLRPLTLLIGENSSGKTSFLAAARLTEKMRSDALSPPDFNEEPFFLGGFDEVANYRGGRAGRADRFRLGSTVLTKAGEGTFPCGYLAEFTNARGRPILSRFAAEYTGHEFHIDFAGASPSLSIRTPSHPTGIPLSKPEFTKAPQTIQDSWVFIQLSMFGLSEPLLSKVALPQSEKEALARLAAALQVHSTATPYAAAPIRAQPRRTYELLNDTPRPQGDHVPVLLAQLQDQAWDELRKPLEKFARASGLFDEIAVKRLGKTESSPFQIYVKLGGPPRNLIDVGYGVSQLLPLLVVLLRDKARRMYLIQQPEVHLHPRAQAELGSLFARLAKAGKKQLLVETHSDYIVDRVRMEVREGGSIKAEDVILLYFERANGEVTIHPITLDEHGNLLDVPPSYRSFFLREEERLLGLADVHHP